jgi:DNA-binding GntR family transcriptional regulator
VYTEYVNLATQHRIVTDSLGRQVADALRHEILAGRLQPDEVLQQDALCSMFGTSRMPIRDALRQLCHEGFLVWLPKNQAKVAAFTRPDVEDMFEVQSLLSGRLARRATKRATDEELDELERLHEEMLVLTQQHELGALWDLNRTFHRRIDSIGASPKLEASLRTVTIDLHRDALYVTERQSRRSNVQHAELMAAMRERNAFEAEAIMAEHVLGARDEVIRHLSEVGVLRD